MVNIINGEYLMPPAAYNDNKNNIYYILIGLLLSVEVAETLDVLLLVYINVNVY